MPLPHTPLQLKIELEASVNSKIAGEVMPRVETRGRSWLLPFIGLSAVLAALSVLGYSKYRYLLKAHYL
jgi:hypothetical protein